VYIYISLWEGPNSQRCLQGFLNVSDDAAAHDHEALEIIELNSLLILNKIGKCQFYIWFGGSNWFLN